MCQILIKGCKSNGLQMVLIKGFLIKKSCDKDELCLLAVNAWAIIDVATHILLEGLCVWLTHVIN
jgi:hypothetical protein